MGGRYRGGSDKGVGREWEKGEKEGVRVGREGGTGGRERRRE